MFNIILLIFIITLPLTYNKLNNFIISKKTKKAENQPVIIYNYNDFELTLVKLINQHRQSLKLNNLILIDFISIECETHNNYMISKNKASHDNFNSRFQLIKDYFNINNVGENIGYNYSKPADLLTAWLKSQSHADNLNNKNWTHFGISQSGKFVTNIFIKK